MQHQKQRTKYTKAKQKWHAYNTSKQACVHNKASRARKTAPKRKGASHAEIKTSHDERTQKKPISKDTTQFFNPELPIGVRKIGCKQLVIL